MQELFRWFEHAVGMTNPSGPEYGFWSGFGSDISELIQLLVIGFTSYVVVRKHNCHVKGCLNVFAHPVPGTPYLACKKHHPLLQGQNVTAEQIRIAHKASKRR